jgi:hypothetical protein
MSTAIATEQSTALALTPAQRAAVALGSAQHRVNLAELVRKSAGIVAVLNADAREEAHRAAMTLKTTRVVIEKAGKAAREDATAFSKAVIAEEKALVDMVRPEEERVLGLRDQWDAAREAERQAKLAAEQARVAKIADYIAGIREHGTDVVFIDKTAAETQASINSLEARPISDTIYQERLAEAIELKATTLAQMREVLATRVAAEAAEAERVAAIEAENKRIAAERAELAKLRAEQEAAAAAQRAEIQRQQAILAEQAEEADRKFRADRAAAAAANLEADRVARVERERVAAEVKAQLDAQQAAIAAERQALADERAAADKLKADTLAAEQMAARVLADHAEALVIDQEFDVHAAADLARAAEAPAPELADTVDALQADLEFLDELSLNANLDMLGLIDRLAKIDFVAVRAKLTAEAA